MTVLHLVAISWGGSYDYTHNIHRNLVSAGYHSYIAIAGRRIIAPDEKEIKIHQTQIPLAERIKRRIHNLFINKVKPFLDSKYTGTNFAERITQFNAKDLVHALPEKPNYIFVHWVSGYANAKYVSDLQYLTGAKVFYFMIDEAILSGACHYPWDCLGYQSGCKDCKMTNSLLLKHFIRQNFLFKKKYLVKEKNVIYPTTFDLLRLKKSPLWEDATTYRLLEAIDETLFSPLDDNRQLRKQFNIPDGKKVVFFGCSYLDEIRKGMKTLITSLSMIERKDVVFLAAGKNILPDMGLDIIFAGHLDMKALAQAYQVADVFVCPSLEDSGPQMINMGIMSCTPVVACEMGVALDIVQTGVTGYRAKYNDAEDMAKGINIILDLTTHEYLKMSQRCRELGLMSFSRKVQMDFFHKLLK